MHDLKRECQEALPEIIAALVAALKTSGERVQAANTLLAYGFGKPVARIDHRVIRSFTDLTDEELTAIIASGEETAEGNEEYMH